MLEIQNPPIDPGCYLYKNKKDEVIYVGKAKNLKKRVKSYLNKKDLDPKTQHMINHAESIEYIVTSNEVEALILESNLIKKYQPRYNIRFKDAKSFAYIQLTNEDFPRVLLTRNKIGKGKFYGPFVSAHERDYILQFIRKTFALRTCKKLPKKTCLRYHIGLCDAPCIGHITIVDYNKKIEKVKLILSGNAKKLLKQMEVEMKIFSNNLQFEKAVELRNQVSAIKGLEERQNIQRQKTYNEDIINYRIKNHIVYLLVFNIYKGTLLNKNEFMFEYHNDFMEEFIIQYYAENKVPNELIVPFKTNDSLKFYLEKISGKKVKIVIPQKGEKKQLLKLVDKNIEITFFIDEDKIISLRKNLKLQETPKVIECFDISHLSGSSTVGSMVQFRNGKPDKNNYRRFRIKTVDKIDDYAAIAEIVRRRYKRLKNENSEFPNLIIIDGGRGQLNFAMKELEKLDMKIPIISIAKQFEEIYMPGIAPPIRLQKKDKALLFIQEIRDEAHRFAIKYNRLLRKKELIP